jgi:hypothetical protein
MDKRSQQNIMLARVIVYNMIDERKKDLEFFFNNIRIC